MASRYSSVARPRSAKGGAPSASNSSFSQPTPQPTISRPLESTSIVASILAVSTGWRCGTTMTEVRSCTRWVRPARKASVFKLVQAFAGGARRPFAGLAIRVAGGDVARHHHVVVDADEAEAQPLGRLGDGDIALPRAALAARHRRYAEVHRRPPVQHGRAPFNQTGAPPSMGGERIERRVLEEIAEAADRTDIGKGEGFRRVLEASPAPSAVVAAGRAGRRRSGPGARTARSDCAHAACSRRASPPAPPSCRSRT